MSAAEPRAPSREDARIAWALFGLAFVVLFATQGPVGYVRDESIYFEAGRAYAGWVRLLLQNPQLALTDAVIVRHFDFNHEHPVLMKLLFGLSHLVFHDGLGVLSPAAAFRVPAFAASALILALIYLMGAALYGRRAGLFGALSFLLVPRQFFNAHLSAFDVPIAAMWLLTVYTFWRAETDRRYWLWCGLSFGLAMATKHNALFLPFVLAPFALYRAWRTTKDTPAARTLAEQFVLLYGVVAGLYGLVFVALTPVRFQQQFLFLSPHSILFVGLIAGSAALLKRLWDVSPAAFRALAPVAAMAFFGPALFYLHWPYLWHHPVDRTSWYLAFHATHNHYTWFYLGRLLREPPFPLDYVVIKTALTVPTSLFLPMVLGFLSVLGRAIAPRLARFRGFWADVNASELLVMANAIASIAIISHPDVPHFGGVKHWFPSMPFLAILSGYSVSRAADALAARVPTLTGKSPWVVSGPLFGLLLLPALIGTVRVHPYGTSFYSELAGGLPGAASLGMQRQFWSNNVTGVLPWLNEHAPRGARVWFHEVTGLAVRDYQENGLLRPDIVAAGGPGDAQIAAYQYHQEFREQEMNIWQAFGTQRPATGLYIDETPQVVVYVRP